MNATYTAHEGTVNITHNYPGWVFVNITTPDNRTLPAGVIGKLDTKHSPYQCYPACGCEPMRFSSLRMAACCLGNHAANVANGAASCARTEEFDADGDITSGKPSGWYPLDGGNR